MTIVNLNVVRLAVVWELGASDQQVNVWHVKVDSVPATQNDLREDLSEWVADMYTDVTDGMPTSLIHQRTEVFNVTSNVPEPWLPADVALDGIALVDPLPAGVSALIWARTAVSHVIGKKYLPTFSSTVIVNGLWDSGATACQSSISAKWLVPYTGANGTEITPGVYSPTTNIFHLPISVGYNNKPAYQRRRKQGRGA